MTLQDTFVLHAVASQAHRLSRIAALSMLAAVAACGVDTPETFGTYEANLVAQLDAANEALSARGLPLQLVGYQAAPPLDSDVAVRAAKAEIVDPTAMVPRFNGVDASSLVLNTIAERTLAYRDGSNDQDVVANIESIAFPSIEAGQKALDVTWESEGRQFQTKLVYDENGVVYDNMLSNIAFVEAGEVTAAKPPGSPDEVARLDGITAFANQMFSTRFVNLTIQWVWGGTRGQVQLDHYVISCDGWVSFCDDGGQSNAWMSVGSASGQTRRNALRKPRISKLAWAYGWATPTASFSITWNPGTLSFSASTGGVGSAGKGSGIHTIF
jgi:hypothetical protein